MIVRQADGLTLYHTVLTLNYPGKEAFEKTKTHKKKKKKNGVSNPLFSECGSYLF